MLLQSITNVPDIAPKKLRALKPIILNSSQCLFETSGIQNTVQFTCIKPPKEWLIHIEDLIKPKELKNLKEWDDYVLLIHNSDKASIIKKDGLRCCDDINPKLAAARRSLGFSNDPDLIYFRPKTPNSYLKINNDSIVIAVPKEKVRVFNQEERVSQNFGFYCGRSMPVDEYDKLISQIGPEQCLRSDKQIVSLDNIGRDYYIPEVCFADRYIPTEYFIK